MKVQRATLAIIAAALVLAYFVILGEAGQVDPHPIIRIVNAAAAGTLILTYLVTAPKQADRVDRGILLGLLLFAAAAVLAQFPRQAFDALLAALLYAAAFFVARTLLALEGGRIAFTRCLIGLSALLTFLIAARWLLPALEWWSLTGWSVLPPLDLSLPATPWGHRHDLALLIVLLYPAWWVGRINPLRAAMATVVGSLTLLIVLVDGSRTVWLAMGVASAALLTPFVVRHWPRDRRRQVAIGLALATAAGVAALSGIAGPLIERILTMGSIEARGAMWGPLLDAWLSKPVTGHGPGSFPWVLQLTDYFDTNAWAPRHPDSVVLQLLPEAGLLGATAMFVIVVTLLPPFLRSRSQAARWVLITFAVAGLAANPTDFGFLVAVAIGWAAFAVPREVEGPVPALVRHRFAGLASLACVVVIAVAWTATAVADVAYLSARSSIQRGRVDEAIPQLELARRLDPGMALYARQLGTAQLLTDNAPAATLNLEDAAQLNPSDDLAWRVLALAHSASGDPDSAWAALERAIETQRSDPTNLLLRARWQAEDGHHQEALATLGEVVQAWPEIVAAPGWSELLPPTISTLDVIEVAFTGAAFPSTALKEGRVTIDPMLAIMAGRTDLAEESAEEKLGPSLGPMYVAVMGCSANSTLLLERAPDAARRTSLYWSLVATQSALDGQVNERALRLFAIMTGDRLLSGSSDETLNPLDENGNGGFSADLWGYRRLTIVWPDYEELPSPRAGTARWLLEPLDAMNEAGLDTLMEACG
ncbi:MAG: O-antigen ligase family protein [Chloroflexota bacterium]